MILLYAQHTITISLPNIENSSKLIEMSHHLPSAFVKLFVYVYLLVLFTYMRFCSIFLVQFTSPLANINTSLLCHPCSFVEFDFSALVRQSIVSSPQALRRFLFRFNNL